ncbi:MAG: helix-turn-helix transcriptional regulator [Nanoarchaeota archaeon]|nr:helix-turn-helix transcriptional regulator [Nanoarchaeota archaeon]
MDNKVKKYRKMLKLRQNELAEQLSVSRQTIIAIEAGKRDPSLSLAFKISKLFNLSVEDVFNR